MPVISNDQNPVDTNSTPTYQNWGFSPSSYTVNYIQGQAMPAPLEVMTTFKDVIGTPAALNYSNIRYRTELAVIGGMPICVVMSGPLFTNGFNVPYANGLNGIMTYTFQNLNTLAVGTYTFTALHRIRGVYIDGNTQVIASATFTITINIFSSTAPVISPNPIYYNWVINGAGPVNQTFTISGNNWNLRSPKWFFFGAVPGATLVQPTEWGGAELTGSGNKTIIMGMFAGAVPEEIIQNPITLYLEVNGGQLLIPIIVTFVFGSGLMFSPQSLHFTSYKGISDAPAQEISAYYNGTYTIARPPWLTIASLPATQNAELTVGVLSADNMEPGIYSANCKVSSGGIISGYLKVTYEVIGAILSPYTRGGFAFTLDKKFLTFVSTMDNTYYDLTINARVYEFYTNTPKDISQSFKIVLFKRRQEFNIGLIIDRLMYRLPDWVQESSFPYKVAEVSLDATERSTVDANYSESYHIPGFKFVAGLQPVIKKNCGFLDVNTGASRVTAKAYTYINFIAGYFQNVLMLKNGEVFNSYQTFGGINSRKVYFEDWGAAPGDVFEYRISTSEGDISKFFKVFPEGYESNYIVWENEYKLKSVIEFTGKYSVKSDIENRTQLLYQQLVDVLTKLESTKSSKLTINTGWLLKSEKPAVESLIRAKRAALVVNDKIINLVPISKSIINVDSDEALISFDVEFEINRAFNEEIYSF